MTPWSVFERNPGKFSKKSLENLLEEFLKESLMEFLEEFTELKQTLENFVTQSLEEFLYGTSQITRNSIWCCKGYLREGHMRTHSHLPEREVCVYCLLHVRTLASYATIFTNACLEKYLRKSMEDSLGILLEKFVKDALASREISEDFIT